VRFLFLFFIAIPLIEMFLLFEVSDQIGGLSTIALVVLTAVIGVQVLKRQGLSTLLRANQRIEAGELPAQEIVEGMMLAGAGALLLTPGFITDTLGFILITGPMRRPLARKLINVGFLSAMKPGPGGGFTMWSNSSTTTRQNYSEPVDGNIVEGEYSEEKQRLDDRNLPKPD
jgi:UPF0716 protein FxsA